MLLLITLSVNNISPRCYLLQFSFRQVKVGYVKKLMDLLNPKRAAGQDKISPKVFTVSSEVLAVPLTNLIITA